MIDLRSNTTFTVNRRGAQVLTDIDALCLPARPEIAAMQGTPADKLFAVMVDGTPDIHEQDVLVDELDMTKTYLVTGVAPFASPRARHTEITAMKQWGTQ